MNMEDMYDLMKDALKHFGLSFHEMDQVTVMVKDDQCFFEFGNQRISFTTPKE